MNEREIWIHLEGEAPKIGSGRRKVIVKEGDKWAYLTNVANGNRQRIPLTLLDQIEEQMEARNGV